MWNVVHYWIKKHNFIKLVCPKGFECWENWVYTVGFIKPKKVSNRLIFLITVSTKSVNAKLLWVKLEYATSLAHKVAMPNTPRKWALLNIHHFQPWYHNTLSPFFVLYWSTLNCAKLYCKALNCTTFSEMNLLYKPVLTNLGPVYEVLVRHIVSFSKRSLQCVFCTLYSVFSGHCSVFKLQ